MMPPAMAARPIAQNHEGRPDNFHAIKKTTEAAPQQIAGVG